MENHPRPLTPEEVIRGMAQAELQELLRDLSLDASESNAIRLQTLVKQLDDFEAAIEIVAGPPTLKRAA